MPVPLLLIVEGNAKPSFPSTSPASPSQDVAITMVRYAGDPSPRLPIYIHWAQWNDIFVPLLQDGVVTGWKGKIRDLGSPVLLLNNVVGPGGEVIFPAGYSAGTSRFFEEALGRLFGSDRPVERGSPLGQTAAYLSEISSVIFAKAQEEGY